jgi:hypothetical protein
VEGSCEHGNEPLGSIKCWEDIEQLHNWQSQEGIKYDSDKEKTVICFYLCKTD